MKKPYLNSVGILCAMLCLVFTACNQGITAGKDTGTVRVVLNSAAARAVDEAGLPQFDSTNTRITITGEDGTVWKNKSPLPVTLTLPIGTKISVKAVVITAAGIWSGSSEHSVTEGINTVSVKLSKTPTNIRNILGTVSDTGNALTLKLASGKVFLNHAAIDTQNKAYPITARDSIGRIYVLYKDTAHPPAPHFKRFNVEGVEDSAFEAAIAANLPSGVTLSAITNMTVDRANNYIFLFDGNPNVYCFKEKEDKSFEYLGKDLFPTGAPALPVIAAAAYKNVVFVADDCRILYACEFEVKDDPASTAGARCLKFKPVGTDAVSAHFDKLRSDTAFANDTPYCTGLFAEEDGVYCLVAQNLYDTETGYALGQLIRYTYSGGVLTAGTGIGLHPDASSAKTHIAFDTSYFSTPAGFIGYDAENLYIADDGSECAYANENWHTTKNHNRIAAFNRKTGTVTFSNSEATWYTEKPEYKEPETKLLLWDKSNNDMRYWLGENGTEAAPADPAQMYVSTPTNQLTDAFCYDQDGNLYVLRGEGGVYRVIRFELKNNSYNFTQGKDLNLGIPASTGTVTAIAADVSNGKNYLYCATQLPAKAKVQPRAVIQRYTWTASDFAAATMEEYTITIAKQLAEPAVPLVTALAANRDGVFVGVKQPDSSLGDKKYQLKVIKYKKEDGTATDGSSTIGLEVFQYTNLDGEGLNAKPSSGEYKEITGVITGLQVSNRVLYALRCNEERKMKAGQGTDALKTNSVLYKVGSTAEALPSSATVLADKKAIDTAGQETGYGFYRFIAVRPKKLVIASNAAWAKDAFDSSSVLKGTNKVLEYDLDAALLSERPTSGLFTYQLEKVACGFDWK